MARLLLPRYVLRGRKRASRSARRTARPLRLEHLDMRIVLSGVPDAVCLDTPAEIASEVPPAVDESTAAIAEEATSTTVYLAADGVLHVQPTAEETNIVVRQYVNYEMQEVVEIEIAGQWTSLPVEQVLEIQVHQVSPDQALQVDQGVTIPIELIDVEAVDAAFTESDPINTEPVEAPLGPPDPTTEPEPEGEMLGGRDPDPAPTAPVIEDFEVSGDEGYWVLTGHVSDDKSVDGLVVNFGGVLAGYTATVNEVGIFSLTVYLPSATGGVTAITTDRDGLDSNLAYTVI